MVGGMTVLLRDGAGTGQPQVPTTVNSQGATEISAAKTANDGGGGNLDGRHESEAYYYECATRQRNKGLFVADELTTTQNLFARFTRQNPNGGASGVDCDEERDYYPYVRASCCFYQPPVLLIARSFTCVGGVLPVR